ncbi:hypothetical protein HO133_005176 [Letharia lupina]|uniref:Transcription factor Rba50 n=1 Tax=Letharia lupina TaxID=560253 RepID=A0A8H6F8X4_9LECA|nr:uncharacterized protein HO133_005176 [Letharia lupina]KAF6219351.1 hypothetical protein HO133_005176 [Letharia lupina]
MAVRGQRFHITLDSDEESDGVNSSAPAQVPGFNFGLVGDIKERTASSNAKPPAPPRNKGSEAGFPAHKIRTAPSKFRQRRENHAKEISQPKRHAGPTIASPYLAQLGSSNGNGSTASRQQIDVTDRSKDPSIDQENKQRLAQMSDEEIEETRKELMEGLSSSLIERLLKKANTDEGRNDSKGEINPNQNEAPLPSKMSSKEVTFEETEVGEDPIPTIQPARPNPPLSSDPDAPPLHPPPDLQPASQTHLPPAAPPELHFPQPPKPPDLDPSDPNFLSALHSNYFPSLPSDPSTMAWMTPIDPKVERGSVYSATQESFTPSSLRFDFRGHLLPPRLSAQIPPTKGLHHHAHAPSSAGYTIPELAHLARSAYPAQRCIAYQTLGRVLYRLGRGDFGREGEDLCEGLWELMDQGRVVEGMVAAAAKGEEGGNRSVWVTATEASWLWRKGGGRKWKGR